MNFKLNKLKLEKYNINSVDKFLYLTDKIDYFYNWYKKNKNETDCDVNDLKLLVDKVIVWYELRYPNSYFDLEDIDNFMLDKSNSKKNSDEQWCHFLDFNKFYSLLSEKEKNLLDKPKFPNMVDLYSGSRYHFHVNDDGIINDAGDVWIRRKHPSGVMSCGIFFEGKSLREVENINKEEQLNLNIDNVKNVVERIEYKESIREGLLDTVMYRIIENGGKYYGPRRAVLFAKEFDRKVEIPVQYGDSSLIYEYVNNNGLDELLCYINYFDEEDVTPKTASDILNNQNLIGYNGKPKIKVF